MTMQRNTAYGPVVGVDDSTHSGTHFWKGIPFAQPPVGDLRWRAPLAPEPWTEPRPARAFVHAPMQLGSLFGPGLNNTWDDTVGGTVNQPVGSEDCLYLNIWRPATAETGLPVIFFVYGGSNICGYSADPLYDGAALARAANAVVVTANYRVGLFGWLDVPALRTGDPLGDSGNFGTLDQLLALGFIRHSIAAFGGDPGNITAMGQSSGAVNLYALLTSPHVLAMAEPPFHRAILMSGGLAGAADLPPGGVPLLQPAAYARRQGQVLVEDLLGDAAQAMSPAELAAAMRAKTPAEIFTTLLTRLAPAGLLTTSHIPEGTVVAEHPVAAIRAGAYLKVPILVSTTRDETRLFPAFLAMAPILGGVPGWIMGEGERFRQLRTFDGEADWHLGVANVLHPSYLPVDAPSTGYQARMDLLNQFFFLAQRNAMLGALATQQKDLWCYRFDWDLEPAPWDAVYGASHVFDLPFVLGNFGPWVFAKVMNSAANEGGRLALSAAMMAAVGAFAKGGDPNTPALGVTWPAWPGTLIFDATLTEAALTVESKP